MKKPFEIQQDYIAERLGGKVQPGSGNRWYKKGDVVTAGELIECKCGRRQSIPIHRQVWDKINDEAKAIGKEPVVAVRLLPMFPGQPSIDVMIISLDYYEELRNGRDQTQ